MTKKEEQILALERTTGSPRQTENRSTANRFDFALSYPLPANRNHALQKTEIPKQVRDDPKQGCKRLVVALSSFERVLDTRSRADPLNRIFSGQPLRDDSVGKLWGDSPFMSSWYASGQDLDPR